VQRNSFDRAFFDLSSRIKLRVSGADRLRFLNGQITNDLRKATTSAAIEACVLNAKGKMDAHLFVHLESESFLLDAGPEIGTSLQTRLDRYVIADDVQLEDVTAQLSNFHVLGNDVPALNIAAKIVSVDRFGCEGHDIWVESAEHENLRAALSKNFFFCDAAETELFRIEQGIPRWGRELTAEIIPVEANLEQRCVDYGKGCYIGQETISRMKMSGQRNKNLCGLVSIGGSPLVRGMRLSASGKEIGWITSAVDSARLQKQIALGFVRRGFNSVGSRIDAIPPTEDSVSVSIEVVDLPFAPEQ
jgi:folate-binding protein YgfZ